MTPISKSHVILFALFAVLLPCCAGNMQQRLDAQQNTIAQLQQRTQETDRTLRKLQAGYHSDLDKIRLEIQALKGQVEKDGHYTAKNLAQFNQRLAAIEKKQGAGGQAQPRQADSNKVVEVPLKPTPPTEQEVYDRAYVHLQKGETDTGRKLFYSFLKEYPASDLADNALYWIGTSYYQEKQYERAITSFDDVIKKFPQGNKVPDAYYLQALSFDALNDSLTAQILLETLMQKFPSASAAKLGKKAYDELQSKNP